MARLSQLFDRLSLRQRFIAPMLLAMLIGGIVAAAFVYESYRQSAVFHRIADESLASFNEYAAAHNRLTETHVELYGLMNRAEQMDEGALYDEAKQHLYQIEQDIAGLKKVLFGGSENLDPAFAQVRNEILRSTEEYRKGVTSAIAMTTVNLDLAPAQLDRANKHFSGMSAIFLQLLDLERSRVTADFQRNAESSAYRTTAIAAFGGAIMGLTLVLAVTLARVLSRQLDSHIGTLVSLGRQAGAAIAIGGGNELDRIAQAVAAFRQSLIDLRESHDHLEQRVRDRTRELQEINDELRSEVTRRQAAEGHLRIYAEVIRSTGEAVVITDVDGIIVEVNPAYQRATGRLRDEAIGSRLYEASRDPGAEAFHQTLWAELKQNGYWSGEIQDHRTDGQPFPSWALINAVRDADGTLRYYVCVSRDISVLKQNERELERLAFYDALTGLPNRTLFKDRLNVALAEAARQDSTLAVMFLDLDRFKYVNDTLGHAAGDALLKEISRRIGSCLRETDTLARMGGDEFTILLTHCDSEANALDVGHRIIEAVCKPVDLDGGTVFVGTSIGVSFFAKDGTDSTTLQKNADAAMYVAKEMGRGQCRMFKPDMLADNDQRLKLSVKIERALETDAFTLQYQPILDLDTNALVGMEALIRWNGPDGEVIEPSTFLPHAEVSGLIKRIDSWALEHACQDALQWRDAGRAVPVTVNLSAVTLQQSDIVKTIKDVLCRTLLPPTMLNLEITEAAVKTDPNTMQAVLEEIASLGVRFSVNDFGASYSSLNYLSQFPINCLKLNSSFVDGIGNDQTSEDIIQTLLHLAQKMNIQVSAVGVESAAQQAFLSKVGCRIMQGRKFIPPIPNDELSQWFTSSGFALTPMSDHRAVAS